MVATSNGMANVNGEFEMSYYGESDGAPAGSAAGEDRRQRHDRNHRQERQVQKPVGHFGSVSIRRHRRLLNQR